MKARLSILALTLALASAVVAMPASANAAPTTQAAGTPITVPLNLTGTLSQALGGVTGTFTGNLTINNFTAQNGQVLLNGVLNGTITNAAGQIVRTVTNFPVQLPLTGGTASGSCSILTLDLGPIHLDLLGLVVDTNAIHLAITAQQGPGNLLGNLLCGVAHLLDSNASANAVANVLNNVLGLV